MWRLPLGLVTASAMAAVLCVGIASATPLQTPPIARDLSYEDFVRLDAKQRREAFGRLTPESKASIVRTHAERWLSDNRQRLSSNELSIFQEIIATVTPDLYRKPPDPSSIRRERDINANSRCRVNPEDVVAAFDVFEEKISAAKTRWAYLDRAKCWVGWITESLVDYLGASMTSHATRSSQPAPLSRATYRNSLP